MKCVKIVFTSLDLSFVYIFWFLKVILFYIKLLKVYIVNKQTVKLQLFCFYRTYGSKVIVMICFVLFNFFIFTCFVTKY